MALTDCTVVLVTVDTQKIGHGIAEVLVRDRLAACVNLFQIHSVYSWDGRIQKEDEWQLVIKTTSAKVAAIEDTLNSIHPYEVPEIIALPIQQGSQPYLNWLTQQVAPMDPAQD